MQLLGDWLDAPAPGVSEEAATRLAREFFGISARARPLYAERDRNFRLDLEDGSRLLLKVANADADPANLALQARALQQVAKRDPTFPVPRQLPTLDGAPLAWWTAPGGQRHAVRMMSWLEGAPIDFAVASATARHAAGAALARLGLALRGCDDEGAPSSLPWDLGNTGALRSLMPVLGDPALRSLAGKLLDRFDAELSAALSALPRQLVHNDLNPDNVLYDVATRERVSGIIDFGDMVTAPAVCDLAVAASYHLSGRRPPLADAWPVISGYHAIAPLPSPALDILLPLVECRLLATLLIQGSRSGGENLPTRVLRPSAREAAARLEWLDGRREDWNAPALRARLDA